MAVGFVIWSFIAALIIGIGIWSWNLKKPAAFFAGVTPPRVKNVTKYNHAVGILWFAYALLFELTGLPLLFQKQNSAMFILSILGAVGITIGLMIAYHRILKKYQD